MFHSRLGRGRGNDSAGNARSVSRTGTRNKTSTPAQKKLPDTLPTSSGASSTHLQSLSHVVGVQDGELGRIRQTLVPHHRNVAVRDWQDQRRPVRSCRDRSQGLSLLRSRESSGAHLQAKIVRNSCSANRLRPGHSSQSSSTIINYYQKPRPSHCPLS